MSTFSETFVPTMILRWLVVRDASTSNLNLNLQQAFVGSTSGAVEWRTIPHEFVDASEQATVVLDIPTVTPR